MPRTIEFQGRTIEVPDGASDADVAGILNSSPPDIRSAAERSGVPTPPGIPRITVGPAPKAEAPIEVQGPPIPYDSSTGQSLKIGAQGVGRGLASVAGFPVDLMTGALNLGSAGVNAVTGTSLPQITTPFGGSESIRNAASSVASSLGAPPVSEAMMTPGQHTGYNIDNYATQFAIPGGLLAAAPKAINGAKVAPTLGGRVADAFTRPYADAPVRTAVGDAAGGAGAGVTQEFLDNNMSKDSPYRPLAEMGSTFGGAAAGQAAVGFVEGLGHLFRSMLANRRSDTNVPINPTTKAPFSMAETERAARTFQGEATDKVAAQRNIQEGAAQFTNPSLPGERPLSSGEVPTSGLLSRDPGIVTMEAGARKRDSAPFIQRDQQVKQAAAENVNGLRDPNADLNAPRAVARAEADSRIGIARDTSNAENQIVEGDVNRRITEARSAAERAVQQAQTDVQSGITGAQSRLAAAEQSLREVEAEAQRQGAPIAARANTDAKAQASRALDRTVVDQGYIPARTEKNRQFDQAPGRNDQLPADDVIAAARAVQRGINDLAPGGLQMPGEFVQRLRAIEPRMVEAEGPVAPGSAAPQVNVGGPGTALGQDLADIRKYLGTAYETAQRSGNFDLANNIATLRRSINYTLDEAPGYAEANANYQQFADRFRPSPNDEGAKFTRQIDRDPQRGNTPPSQTAERFLAGPEKAQALQRMMDGSPQGVNAVRDYLRSDFGMSALNPNGTLNANRAAAWGRNNADVLAQFPQIRNEFDGMLATARRGDQLSELAQSNLELAQRGLTDTQREGARTLRDTERAGARDVRTAEQEGSQKLNDTRRSGEQRVRQTEQEVERSAAGTLLKEDPRDVASKLLGPGSKYTGPGKIDEINALVANDPAAKRGWKAAVAEVLTDKVQSTREIGETHEVQAARLAKEFKNNEQTLAKVFDPEEMNTLRQAHKLLEYSKESEKRALSGSQTAERAAIPTWVQLAARHIYGDLHGGGIIKRFKLLMSILPSNRDAAEQVANIAWFDPGTAAYLLGRKVSNTNAVPFNAKLRQVESLTAGGRASDEN